MAKSTMSKMLKNPVKALEGLSGPALIVLLTAVIGAVIVLIPGDMLVMSGSGEVSKVKVNFWERLWVVLITQLPVAFILVYSFQCMVTGSCTTWAWFWALVMLFFQVLAVLAYISVKTA